MKQRNSFVLITTSFSSQYLFQYTILLIVFLVYKSQFVTTSSRLNYRECVQPFAIVPLVSFQFRAVLIWTFKLSFRSSNPEFTSNFDFVLSTFFLSCSFLTAWSRRDEALFILVWIELPDGVRLRAGKVAEDCGRGIRGVEPPVLGVIPRSCSQKVHFDWTEGALRPSLLIVGIPHRIQGVLGTRLM
jgi:hypothetical protein